MSVMVSMTVNSCVRIHRDLTLVTALMDSPLILMEETALVTFTLRVVFIVS